jgi:hypothetical protein
MNYGYFIYFKDLISFLPSEPRIPSEINEIIFCLHLDHFNLFSLLQNVNKIDEKES